MTPSQLSWMYLEQKKKPARAKNSKPTEKAEKRSLLARLLGRRKKAQPSSNK